MAAKKEIDKFLKMRFGMNERINLYKKLKAFTEEEFPVYDSLVKFKTRFEKKKDYKAKIIEAWLDHMKYGNSFSSSIKGWVPESELNLISSGEEGKGIESGLSEAIKFAESSKKIKSTIISGATYPLILFVVIMGFIAMFSLKMAPPYLQFLPIERWPSLGADFYYVSKAVVDYWYMVLLVFCISSFFIAKTIPTWTGRVREILDNVPPWSVYKVYQSSAFLISLASMMQSGTPLNEALNKIQKTNGRWVGRYVEKMSKNLKKGGKNFGQHLDVGLLDDETAGDVIDYSELGKFEEAVYTIGEKNLEESIVKIEQRVGVVRTLMIALVGIVVGMIYFTSIQLSTSVADVAASGRSTSQQK